MQRYYELIKMQQQKEDILSSLQEKSNKKTITVLIISIFIVIFAIFGFLLCIYLQTPEHKLNLGANIEEARLNENNDIVYIKLAGGINEGDITKIKFIFKDVEGKEHIYETSEGVKEILVPFKRSFWDWLFGKPKYEGVYDHEINADEINLNNFNNINEVSVLFEYKTETGDINETGIITSANITKIPACNDKIKNGDETGIDCGGSCKACVYGGGGGGSGGDGNGQQPCTSNCQGKQCGSDGCGGSCGSCNESFYCNESGKCIVVLNCTNDVGCTTEGSFCNGNISYNCSLGGDGCLDRNIGQECNEEYTCQAEIGCAKIYYVSKEASCNDNYTLEQNNEQHPWCNLSKTCASDGSYIFYIPIRDIPEGSLVVIKEGNYGIFGEDARSNCYPNSKTERNKWTIYKADAGARVVFNGIALSGHTPHQGSPHLIFDGIEINGSVYFEYSDNVQIKNCNIKTKPANYPGLETGIYKPYFYPNGHAIEGRSSNNILIENNSVSDVYRAIGGGGNNWTIRGNHLFNLAEDGINAVPNNFLIENNLIHDSHSIQTTIDMHGIKTGNFTEGEEVIQGGTGARGIAYRWQTSGAGYLPVWQTTSVSFKTQINGGGTITGQQSWANVSNITLVDGAHIDAIHIESSSIKDIIIRNNTAYGFSNQGISLYGHGGMQNVTFLNNIVYNCGKGFVVSGVNAVNFYNNTAYNAYVRLENSADHPFTSIINNMYNNIFGELANNGDIGDKYIRVVNHGNNIFGNNPNGSGGIYKFYTSSNEIVNYNIANIFVDAANSDFRPRMDSLACNGSINPSGVAVGALPCVEVSAVNKTSQISQYNITWYFDKEYEYGQFANGDYWVVGPVTITSISPGWDGEKHGSMVNPIPIPPGKQAYDSRHGSYDASLRVDALVTLNPNTSLISAISWIIGESGCPILVSGIPRPTLKTAAVLTVLNSAPPAGSFRPPYSGNNKPMYSTSDLRKEFLLNLPLVANTPNIQNVAKNFERVWLDHFAHHGDGTQYTSPTENMPNYGLSYSIQVGEASLLLMLNETELISQQGTNKDLLLTRFVQLGIDLYGVVENGGYWWTGGGLNAGRKWPILFAGIMLDHSGMKNIGTRSPTMPYLGFQEDGQTFYVNQSNVDYSHSAAWSPDPRGDIMPYEVSDIGLPEWGGIRCYEPWNANKAWRTTYRDCCTGHGWVGMILAAHIMNTKSLWNHDALFDYIDRWVKVQNQYYTASEVDRGYSVYGGNFQRDMWNAYHANYGCVWTRNNQSNLYSLGHYNCSNCLYNCLQSPYCGDDVCDENETVENCERDCGGISGQSSSLSPFTKLWNFFKSLLTAKTGNAITGNVVSESKIANEKSESFFEKVIELFKKLFGFA